MNLHQRLMATRLIIRLGEPVDLPTDDDSTRQLAALLKARPDAPYRLMQHALRLEADLEQARSQVEQLRQLAAGSAPDARAGPPPSAAAVRRSAGEPLRPIAATDMAPMIGRGLGTNG